MFAHLIVSGRVQGVGFRFLAQQQAIEFHLSGWVQNQSDGTVEIEIEGEKEKVEQFIQYVKTGFHKFMRIEHVDIKRSDDKQGYNDFTIR